MNFLPPNFYQILDNFSPILTPTWEIIKNWWWFPLPFIFWKPFSKYYLFWRRMTWTMKQKRILLEIKWPREILKPIRAMETVMASIHGVVAQPPDWWENYIDGQTQMSVSFDIVSIGGETHFYIRTPEPYRDGVEAALYSQYPEIEIKQVDDYVKYIPQNIPNEDWDLWGTDYKTLRDDHYPIKTYLQFETEHEAVEEKRVDPVATLLEAMAKIKEGEQLWIQILAAPIIDNDPLTYQLTEWVKKGQVIRDKLARREEKEEALKPIIQEAAQIIVSGPSEEKEKEREIIPPEMKLTPGEREIITALEQKLSKPIFECGIRFIYLGKKEVWFKPNFRLAFSFFNDFMTINLNGLIPIGKTLTKIHKSWFLPFNLLRPRRAYIRARRLFRNYVMRFPSFFPKPGGTFILNTEELASLFHFPGEAVAPAPGAPRLEAKKAGGPSELPVE